jgi:hypothetical protein
MTAGAAPENFAKHDAYDVYVLTQCIDRDVPLPDETLRFSKLPLLALVPGTPLPAGLTPRSVRPRYPRAYILWLQGMNYCVEGEAGLMNLSLGPSANLAHAADDPDPLYAAIEAAAQVGRYCVVAAGNRFGLDSLQFLARSPWTISVGAVDNDRKLLKNSARGSPGAAGPTVVANGYSKATDGPFAQPGTSFAAPRVTFVLAWLRTLIDRIIADLREIVAGTWTALAGLGVPIIGMLDTGITPEAYDALTNARPVWISRTAHQRDWLRGVFGTIDRTYGLKSRVANDFAGAKRALECLAEQLPAYAAYEVGAGLISLDALYRAVRAFTPELWIRMFADDPQRAALIPRAELDALNERFGNLFEPDYAELLIEHFDAGVGKYILRVA